MAQKLLLPIFLFFALNTSLSQQLDTQTLDAYFDALDQRNEAMGSISISKNGHTLYSRAIGYRYFNKVEKLKATTATNYRIWSITKLYTAVMIMQLVEEGRLTLDTPLIQFYPEIPNADHIVIKDLLQHKSGIHDFTQNKGPEDWDSHISERRTQDFMVAYIAQYGPDFKPGERFSYSNSNYLLLGYIIEKLDGNAYETSLAHRIASKLGLKSTYFGVGALDKIENKALSYAYKQRWTAVDEGEFSGLIPAGAGGIVGTTEDMNQFIQGLFAGKLVSKESLDAMLPKKETYGLGVMQTSFQGKKIGYGHTGGYIATESSLFYYPEDGLSIAYATNGIVIRKEDILENVLKIYHSQVFGISMDRKLQTILIFALVLIFYLMLKLKFQKFAKIENLAFLGYGIVALFWIGSFLAGHLHGNYSIVQEGITNLDAFYSGSGTFMSAIQLSTGFLVIPYLFIIFSYFRKLEINILPLLPLGILPLFLIGSSLFPFPNPLYQYFTNSIVLVSLGPLLGILLWRKKALLTLRWFSLACLLFMLISILLVINRPSFPEFVFGYWGLIQRSLYLGWTVWLCLLGAHIVNALRRVELDQEQL